MSKVATQRFKSVIDRPDSAQQAACLVAVRSVVVIHSAIAGQLDRLWYLLMVGVLMTSLVWTIGPESAVQATLWVAGGLLAWSLIEYLLHRFLLHRVQPFKGWHLLHHRNPLALIGAPTWLSSISIALGIALPAAVLFQGWQAIALTLGVVTGYFIYTLLHFALHQRASNWPWINHARRRHFMHHLDYTPTSSFGVTSSVWDHAFRTIRQRTRATP